MISGSGAVACAGWQTEGISCGNENLPYVCGCVESFHDAVVLRCDGSTLAFQRGQGRCHCRGM